MTWNFALLAVDQIVNSAAKLRSMSGGQLHVPIVFRGPQGAAHQLAAQHSQVFESVYAHVPGLKVAVPATPRDAKGLLKTAIRDDDPVVFMESEILPSRGTSRRRSPARPTSTSRPPRTCAGWSRSASSSTRSTRQGSR